MATILTIEGQPTSMMRLAGLLLLRKAIVTDRKFIKPWRENYHHTIISVALEVLLLICSSDCLAHQVPHAVNELGEKLLVLLQQTHGSSCNVTLQEYN